MTQHIGKINCCCGHNRNDTAPRDKSYVHIDVLCAWDCCGCNWDDDACAKGVPEALQKPGTRVKIECNKHSHNYEIGKVYEITLVDTDGTFKAKNTDTDFEGNWLRWGEVSLSNGGSAKVIDAKGVPEELKKPGTRVKIECNKHSHNYEIGKVYEITLVDTDGTFKAKNTDTGSTGNWLHWDEVSLSTVGI